METTNDRSRLACRLLQLVESLAPAARTLVDAEIARAERAEQLQALEDGLLLTPGAIDGKNAETRAAQLRHETSDTRSLLREAEAEAIRARNVLRFLEDQLAAFTAAARLIGGTG